MTEGKGCEYDSKPFLVLVHLRVCIIRSQLKGSPYMQHLDQCALLSFSRLLDLHAALENNVTSYTWEL